MNGCNFKVINLSKEDMYLGHTFLNQVHKPHTYELFSSFTAFVKYSLPLIC
jgi:hypothetical protein